MVRQIVAACYGAAVQCPYCLSLNTSRESGVWQWLWLAFAAGTFLMRLLMSFVRGGDVLGQSGVYRCGNCGRRFTVFI